MRDDLTNAVLGPTESRPASYSDLPGYAVADDMDVDDSSERPSIPALIFEAGLQGVMDAFDQFWQENGDELTERAISHVRAKSRLVWEHRRFRRHQSDPTELVEVSRSVDVPEPDTERPTITSDELKGYLAQAAAAETYAVQLRAALAEVDISDSEQLTPELRESIALALDSGFSPPRACPPVVAGLPSGLTLIRYLTSSFASGRADLRGNPIECRGKHHLFDPCIP